MHLHPNIQLCLSNKPPRGLYRGGGAVLSFIWISNIGTNTHLSFLVNKISRFVHFELILLLSVNANLLFCSRKEASGVMKGNIFYAV